MGFCILKEMKESNFSKHISKKNLTALENHACIHTYSYTYILLYIWGFLRYATIIGGLASLSSNNVISSIVTLATIRHMLLWYFGILLKSSVVRESFEWRHPIVEAGKWQVNDGLYAEVPLWCASGPIARRWIVPTCIWKLSDCKNRSECWKVATRGPVGRIL
jgi:hypothetical protein